MTTSASASGISARERLIGRISAERAGPTLVLVGTLHGNEPAGAAALRRVVASLSETNLLVKGDVLALVGNVAAASARERYIDDDLNRLWKSDRIASILRGAVAEGAEDREQRDLLDALHRAFESARGPVALVDFHTTSGPGGPFGIFADTLRSRRFARRFPLPTVLGFEESLQGTLVDYVGRLGHVAVSFEGGQHDDEDSVENIESLAWLALDELGMVDVRRASFLRTRRARLSSRSRAVPRFLEVTYRHAVGPETRFRMMAGFRSFDRVAKGQVIATDAGGDVAVPDNGYLLMPLYQRKGEDGFFVARRVWGFWLVVSALLRHARAGRAAHLLPGVSRDPLQKHVLRVDRRVARWYSLEILHLLGFRRLEQNDDVLLVERRQHDLP